MGLRTTVVWVPAAAIAVLIGCGGEQREPELSPGTGAAYPSAVPDPAVDRAAADFAGSCSFAKPPGPAGAYALAVWANASELGTVRVRSNAQFDLTDRDNLIGEVPSGTALRAQGPIAAGQGDGVGYAVLVRDSRGRVCRGYVSAASVTRTAPGGGARRVVTPDH